MRGTTRLPETPKALAGLICLTELLYSLTGTMAHTMPLVKSQRRYMPVECYEHREWESIVSVNELVLYWRPG